jgi:hypothetical protein
MRQARAPQGRGSLSGLASVWSEPENRGKGGRERCVGSSSLGTSWAEISWEHWGRERTSILETSKSYVACVVSSLPARAQNTEGESSLTPATQENERKQRGGVGTGRVFGLDSWTTFTQIDAGWRAEPNSSTWNGRTPASVQFSGRRHTAQYLSKSLRRGEATRPSPVRISGLERRW